MSPFGVIRVLAEHWDEIRPVLQSSDVAFIEQALGSLPAEPTPEVESVAADIGTILISRLPPGHPALPLISGQMRLATADAPDVADPAAWSQMLGLIRDIPGLGAAPQDADPGAAPEDADSWLLAAPALTEEQVREQGGDPGRADLIRLRARTGQIVLPTFQFSPVGDPIPVVTAINRLLAVADDPWGVADWWLGRNAWLDAIPADLLGRVDDDLLVRAAQAELPGD